MAAPFLTARWEHLVFLNFRCLAALLEPLVPSGTALDTWHGETLVPMAHGVSLAQDTGGAVSYSWRYRGEPFSVLARVAGSAQPFVSASAAQFITEHYWGYTRQRDGGTLEYQVEHPAWPVWQTQAAAVSGPVRALYGEPFGELLAGPVYSAFVATGSAVTVHRGVRLARH